MELKDKLSSLRSENGLTQLALAEKMDVSRQTISRWESGEAIPSSDNLRRLSELYGISVGYLMSNDAEQRPAAVAERPEKAEKYRWRKPALIGVTIGLAIAAVIALLAVAYFAGYSKGVADSTPTYPVHTDILDESDFEGTAELYGW